MRRVGGHWSRRGVLGAGAVLSSPSAFALSPALGPMVKVAGGMLMGWPPGDVAVFKGVPYGASTAAGARFMPPRPASPWAGTRQAGAFGDQCPQPGASTAVLAEETMAADVSPISEDCLSLNIWTPTVDSRRRRPVMVWLHGGGYVSGSGANSRTEGTHLAARQDVVVVTLNHRLNVFGHLYLADLGGEAFADSGMNGILDIVLALQWIRDNIAVFGGDPGNVTLFGQSGGAGKVTTLMAMPQAKGLFHKAICQSGQGMRQLTPAQATRNARAVLDKLGVAPSELERLREIPAEALVKALAEARVPMAPVVDGRSLPRHPFDPDAPAVSAQAPLLIGTTLTESTFRTDTPIDPIDDATLLARTQANLGVDSAAAAEVIAVYRKARPQADATLLYQLISTDSWQTEPIATLAERKARQGSAPVWVYRFDKTTPVRGGRLRAPHTIEIPYVFDNVALGEPLIGTGPDKQALADRVSATWAAFARTGDPNAGGGLPKWPPYDLQARSVMLIDDAPRVESDPAAAERVAITRAKAKAAKTGV